MGSPNRTTPVNDPAPDQDRVADPTPLRFSAEKIAEMRAEVARRLARKRRKRARMIVPQPPPRYDDVFFEGLAWLNGQDGPLP